MASNNVIGYVGGLAIAAGVGVAVVVGSQGTAYADSGTADATSASDSTHDGDTGPKTPHADAAGESTSPVSRVGVTADDTASGTSHVAADTTPEGRPTTSRTTTPTAEDVEAAEVQKLRNLYRGARPEAISGASADAPADTADADAAAPETPAAVDTMSAPAAPMTEVQQTVAAGSTSAAASPAASPAAADLTAALVTVNAAVGGSNATSAAQDVPWSPNPFRPMPPEPAPNDMPGAVWNVEQAFLNLFSGAPAIAPFPREGFELVYRATQIVPWLNLVVPFTNAFSDLPSALAGDKNASQRIINNLVITIQPLAMAYYGYNELADLTNLEQPALDFQNAFFATIWTVLDPFQLTHNAGSSGLPLSTTTPPPYPPATETVTVAAAADPLPVQPDPLFPVAARAVDAPPAVRTTETYSVG